MQHPRTHAPLVKTFGLGLAVLTGLAAAARPAAAQTTFIPDNTTINYAISGDVYVGYDAAYDLSSPTVSLVTGGSVGGDLQLYNSSTLTISGGSADDIVETFGSSTVNVTGGAVGSDLQVYKHSSANVSGGTFGSYKGVTFFDDTAGTFNFAGTGLSSAPDPTGQTPLGGTDYTLTGLLLDGQSLNGDVIDVASGSTLFTLNGVTPAPEPSTLAGPLLGALGLAGLAARRRRA